MMYDAVCQKININSNQGPVSLSMPCQPYSTHFDKISNEIIKLNLPVSPPEQGDITHAIPPWQLVKPQVFIPSHFHKKPRENIPDEAQQYIVKESISNILDTYPSNKQTIYTDGSLHSDTGRAGCAYVVFQDNTPIFTHSNALPRWTCTTRSELTAILAATRHVLEGDTDTLIVSDSKSALQSLTSSRPTHSDLVDKILAEISRCTENGVTIKYTWIPSHIGIKENETADKEAKTAALTQTVDENTEQITLNCFKTLITSEATEAVKLRTDTQRHASITIKHYDLFRDVHISYGSCPIYTGRCDRLAARVKLGYRRPWQVQYDTKGSAPHPVYSRCNLCDELGKNTLQHYVDECKKLEGFRPPGARFYELCKLFMNQDTLCAIIGLYPKFMM